MNDWGMVPGCQSRVRIVRTDFSPLTPQENHAQRHQQNGPPYMQLGTRPEASCQLFVVALLNHDD